MNKTIGFVTIKYNQEGILETSEFVPIIKTVKTKAVTLDETDNSDPDVIQQKVQSIVGSWFNELNDIELADREEYKLETTLSKCEKWDDGRVKKCVFSVVFRQLQPTG